MLEELFAGLENLLSRQRDAVKALCAGTEKQIGVIRDADTDALTTLAQEQLGLVSELAMLDQERLNTLSALGTALGLKRNVTLRELLSAASEDRRTRLASLEDALDADLAALRKLNSVCRAMVKQGLQFSTQMLTAVGLAGTDTYGVGGEVPQALTVRAVDSTV